MRSICFIIAWGCAATLHAQTAVDLKTQSKRVDFSAAPSTKPFKTGTVLPATCTVGDAYFKSDAAAGSNVYLCSTANTWTPQAAGALRDPGANGIVKRTALNTTAVAVSGVDYQEPLSGDVLAPAGQAATVLKINHGDIPLSQPCVGTNAQGQLITGTCSGGGGGLGDPGANGIIKRTALNTTAPATAADLVSRFAGTPTGAKYLRDDGVLATPTAGTIPTTSSVLKGDNAGNATPVTGAASNCVHVDGTSAPCASGSGSASGFTNTDFQCAYTDSHTLTCNPGASASAPVIAHYGSQTYSFTNACVFSITANTAHLFVYFDRTQGKIVAGYGASSGIALTSGTLCAVSTSVTTFPLGSRRMYDWSVTGGTLDTFVAAFDKRATFGLERALNAGAGISIVETDTDLTLSMSAISVSSSNPGCSSAGNIGRFWFDTTTATTALKVCKSVAGTIGWSAITTTP
jgi:hypothetical protein